MEDRDPNFDEEYVFEVKELRGLHKKTENQFEGTLVAISGKTYDSRFSSILVKGDVVIAKHVGSDKWSVEKLQSGTL